MTLLIKRIKAAMNLAICSYLLKEKDKKESGG